MQHRDAQRQVISLILSILGVLLLEVPSASTVAAQDEGGIPIPAAPPSVPVETWVQNRLNAGEEADLNQYTDGERVLPADFVRGLLTHPAIQGGDAPSWITIKAATIRGPLVATDIVVPFSVTCQSCTFEDVVDLSGSTFEGSVSLPDSHFGDLKLARIATAGSLVLDRSTITSSADLSQARIGKELSAQKVEFLDSVRMVDLSRMRVEGSAYFNYSQFRGTVRFFSSIFNEDLEVSDARFFYSYDAADFDRIRVGHSVWLRNTRFERQASFRYMAIENNFDAEDSRYYGANFSNSAIANDLSLRDVRFSDTIRIRLATIGGSVDLTHSTSDGKMDAEFGGINVAEDLILSESTFAGGVLCRNVMIGRDLRVESATVGRSLNCSSARVGGMVVLDRATLHGEASFADATVDGIFRAENTVLPDEDGVLNLSRMAVKRAMDIEASRFSGRIDVIDADVVDLKIRNLGVPLEHLNLSRTVISRDLTLGELEVGQLDALSTQVLGRSVFVKVNVTGQASLQGARLGRIESQAMKWMARSSATGALAQPPRLQGVRFDSIAIDDDSQKLSEFFQMLSGADYSRSAYISSESHLRQQGDISNADGLWIEMRVRERTALYPDWPSWLNPLPWLDLATEKLIGYGRKPWNAFIPALVVVAIGAVIFGRDSVDPAQIQDRDRRYNRVLYSLDKFMPVVNLRVAEAWKVNDCPAWIWWYQYLHTLLGWTIVPFIVATLTGIIK